jgi:hypothetical protein
MGISFKKTCSTNLSSAAPALNKQGSLGTLRSVYRYNCMTLRLDAWMVAWRYLDESGQISDTYEATQRLSAIFGRLTKSGPISPLLLANRAIAEYERDQYLFRDVC